MPGKWRRIDRRQRCPICGHLGGWCLLSADGLAVICPRTESPRRCGEAGWLHRLDSRPALAPAALPASRPATRVQRAADADLDRVYRALLARLRLADQHRQHLRKRGLTDADISRAAYRSLPAGCRASIARQLRDLFGNDRLLTVPGLIVRDGQHGRYLTIAGAPGILIPIRSAADHVVGLVVRPDDPGDGGKYRWLSSVPVGPSPGWRVHVPVWAEPRRRLIIVEGALKADVSSALAPGRTIIGLPGCQLTSEAIEVARYLGGEETLLALDADAATNGHVALAQLGGIRLLKSAGFSEGLIQWDGALGKGLDDLLLTLRRRNSS